MTFAKNRAGFTGGAIYGDAAGGLTVGKSTFVENHASSAMGYGGAIAVQGLHGLNIQNTTFTLNDAGVGGAALFINTTVASHTLSNVTISNNTSTAASGGYGALMVQSGDVTLQSSLVYGNTMASAGDANCNKFLAGNIYAWDNFISSSTDCALTTNTHNSTATPSLSPLSDYGGETRVLMPRTATSLAVGYGGQTFGFCEPSDQRGVTRATSSACTAGAVERTSADVVDVGVSVAAPAQVALATPFTKP